VSDRPNTPLPDELAAVRNEIKRLETREAELKQILLSDPSARTGASWLAEIKTVTTTRTDLKELRANHPALVDEYTFPTEVTRVVLSGITEDGEVVPARQFRKATESQTS
jgi:predicted phage-related endonuclease